jgi:hypothetical protein
MLLYVIIMFFIDLWGFSIDPPYFAYSSVGQENLVLRILTFREPFGTQIDPKNQALIFYHEKHLEHKKSMRWATRPPRAQAVRSSGQTVPPMLVWSSDLRCRPSSSLMAHLDLKTPL